VVTTELGLRLRDAARAIARAAELLEQLPDEPEDDGPPPTFDFALEQLAALKDALQKLEEELNERGGAQI
jgi:hypothetical protein